MTLKLVKLEPKYRRHLNDMMSQWYATGEKIIPYAIRRLDYRDFDNYLANLDVREETGGACAGLHLLLSGYGAGYFRWRGEYPPPPE